MRSRAEDALLSSAQNHPTLPDDLQDTAGDSMKLPLYFLYAGSSSLATNPGYGCGGHNDLIGVYHNEADCVLQMEIVRKKIPLDWAHIVLFHENQYKVLWWWSKETSWQVDKNKAYPDTDILNRLI